MVQKIFSTLLITFLSLGTFAQELQSSIATTPVDLPPEQEAVAEKFATALQINVKTLSRDIVTYSWAKATNSYLIDNNQILPQTPRLKIQLVNNIEWFWKNLNLVVQPDLMGPGFYVARDPVISRRFSQGDDFVLYNVPFKKGFRFVDFRASERFEAKPEVALVLKQMSCPTNLRMLLHKHDVEIPSYCRMIAGRILQLLDADAFVYATVLSKIKTPICKYLGVGKTDSPPSMVVLQTKAIDWANTVVLSNLTLQPNQSPVSQPALSLVNSFWDLVSDATLQSDYVPQPRPWTKSLEPLAPDILKSLVYDKYFGCGDYLEDRPRGK